MFSKEESKKIRQEFWISFGEKTAELPSRDFRKKKWILFKTGITDLSFKFECERKFARVCIDFEQRDLMKRLSYWEKFESLRAMLDENTPAEFFWEEAFILDNGKEIARIYCQLDGVSLYNKSAWSSIYDFFISNMLEIEELYLDYKDFIKDI